MNATSIVAILAALATAASVTALLIRKPGSDRAEPGEFSSSLAFMPILIICGDCCGELTEPRRTSLDVRGRCSTCGGSSYVLASRVIAHRVWNNQFPYGRRPHVSSVYQQQAGKVLPFDALPLPAEKIAI